jgi:hypothetical protein
VTSGTPDSSTNKTDRQDIAEILLKVALNTKSINNCGISTSTYTAYVFQTQSFVFNVVKNPKRSNLASIVIRSEFCIKTYKRKISQQPENCENRNDPDLVQAFLKKWWVESDFKAPNLPLSSDRPIKIGI